MYACTKLRKHARKSLVTINWFNNCLSARGTEQRKTTTVFSMYLSEMTLNYCHYQLVRYDVKVHTCHENL